KYETADAGGRTIYRWKHTNLAHLPEERSQDTSEGTKSKSPSVQLTTFAQWSAMSRWYAGLETSRVEPNADIRAKTQELIADRSTEIGKARAIYDYVAKNVHYINLPFGVAGYKPHSAAEVFKDRYGDGSGKHALLAAMLASAGIPSYAVLVPSSRRLNRTFPSPAQFDHVITAVRTTGGFIWLDSTTGVAPFQFLASSLRNREALLIAPDGAGQIVTTPADPPFLSTQRVEIEGQVSDLGKLTAKLRYFLRGDNGFALRLAFQQAPQSDWKQLGQTLLSLDGIKGEVTSVKPGDPTDTKGPFELDLEYSQLSFLDWSAKKSRVALPLLAIGLPQISGGNAAPIHLGSPLNVNVSLK
ncbi:MAG: transglutaminase domain-containing protein, partial [Blastocatellia bacterium]